VDDYKKLNKQPLKIVLTEFRFSPVMQIAEYIPKLQEAFRKQYPITDKKVEQSVQFQSGGLSVSAIDRWGFIAADKKSAIEISQERLIYYAADYPRFEGYSDACKIALDHLCEIVDPSLILRIGLRYSDLVLLDGEECISDLVDRHYGYPECLEGLGEPLHQRNETFLKTELGALAIRSLYGFHNLSCMPDIQDLPVDINRVDEPSERVVLDFDHFWEDGNGVNFDVDDVLEKLQGLHDISRQAFWKITSDYARNEKWS